MSHNITVKWIVELHTKFMPEYRSLHEEAQDHILLLIRMLQQYGPLLGRPYADTLKGSQHTNMKELRFSAADGVWRVAFAFDSRRKAILLVAGDKAGMNEKLFYQGLIREADKRFAEHLAQLNTERN